MALKKKKTKPEPKAAPKATGKKNKPRQPGPDVAAVKKKKTKEEKLGAEKVVKKKKKTSTDAPTPKKTTMVRKDPRKKKKAAVEKLVSPIGTIMFKPFLLTVNEKNDNPKFGVTIGFDKKTWKTEGKALRQAVLKVARNFYRDDALTLEDFQHPFRDGATMEYESCKDKVVVTFSANADSQPWVVGPKGKKDVWKEKQIKQIKAGDSVRLIGNAYGYDNKTTGVSLGLDGVQFAAVGKPISGGNTASMKLLDAIEVKLDDIDTSEDEDEDEDDIESDDDDSSDDDDASDDDDEESEDDDSDDADEDSEDDEDENEEEDDSDSDDDDSEDDEDSDDEDEDDDDDSDDDDGVIL